MKLVSRGIAYRWLGAAGVVAVLIPLGLMRRRELHRAAIEEWTRGSSSAVQLSGGSARAWMRERAAAVRILGASATRDPALFAHPPVSVPSADSAMSHRLATALSRLNQASATPSTAFSDLWLLNRSAKLIGSASPSAPPAVVTEAMRTSGAADSLIVVGPVPLDDRRLLVVFIQPIRGADSTGRPTSAHPAVIGAVAMATSLDAGALKKLGVTAPDQTSQHTALIVDAGDSVYAYTLARREDRFRVHVTTASQAGPLALVSLGVAGVQPSTDGTPSVMAHIDGLPWGLVRRANLATLFVTADADFAREVAIALIALTILSWLVFVRVDRERARNLRGLAVSEARYRLLADHSTDIIARYAPDGRVLYVSPAVTTVLGYDPQTIVGTYPFALRHDDDAETTHTAIHRALAFKEAARTEHRFRHADGHFVWLETVGTAVRDATTGAVTEIITTSRDIVDAKASEEALKASEEGYRLMFETNPMPMWAFDAETGRFLAVNNAAVAHYGYSRDEFLQMTIPDVRPLAYSHERISSEAEVTDDAINLPGLHHRKKDGTVIDVDLTIHALPFGGRASRLVLINDVTQKHEIEAAFRESNQFVRAILGSSPVAIIATDPDLRVVQWNRAAEQLFGWRADEIVGKRSPLAAPERDRAAMGQSSDAKEDEVTRKDGTTVRVDISVAVIHDAAGAPAGFVTLAVDLTERTRLEAQLVQAQKMEAVGQFAGGIAHDFNNLLTVITAYAELLIADAADTTLKRADLLEIRGAASRAAALVRQLLAFSRRQVLVPAVIDLNEIVGEVEQMLRRVLPPTVNIVTSLDPELRAVFADTGQVEQVLMNLVVNARDAMPNGGTLTITTANATTRAADDVAGADQGLEPGVLLTVSDTGCGMSREVQDRIFEPFFTTKEVGKGTGLGLSTAHGIVTQSGGRLSVSSAEGVGTTFAIHLPAAVDAIAESTAVQPEGLTPGRYGSGFVLLVDDDVAVRNVAKRILESSGYTVLVATDGPEALLLHAQHRGRLDLVVTDMIMPTMTGAVVAATLRADEPQLPVILMSGAADDATVSALEGEPVTILRKPFTPEVFLRTATEALRASSPSHA